MLFWIIYAILFQSLGEKVKFYNTIVLGCGASGCMCALNIQNQKVAMLEISSKPFKKILATGNGRCNITNAHLHKYSYNQDLSKFFDRFDQTKTLQFFEELGLECYMDDEGRYYPISNMAKSVQDVVLRKLESRVDIYSAQQIVSIKKADGVFFVSTKDNEFKCVNLVVATGSKNEDLLNMLEVKYKPFVPSLVALKCDDVKDLNGVRLANAKVSVKIGDISYSEVGEVLYKDAGLSGIVIFNISSLFARSGKFSGKIYIDLLPNMSAEKLKEKIINRKKLNVGLDKIFVGMFANALANEIFRQAKVNTNINSTKISDKIVDALVGAIKNLEYNVCGCYDNNQVYSGGVELKDLDDNLMYKKIPNLYFVGEVCDVDGMCGGYNLQWAWTSGKIVGDSLCC